MCVCPNTKMDMSGSTRVCIDPIRIQWRRRRRHTSALQRWQPHHLPTWVALIRPNPITGSPPYLLRLCATTSTERQSLSLPSHRRKGASFLPSSSKPHTKTTVISRLLRYARENIPCLISMIIRCRMRMGINYV